MRTLRSFPVVIVGLGLLPALFGQNQPPPRPSAGDLREEQRVIGNAYLGDAEFQIKQARERLGSGNHRLAQQSGLWAVEQIAYAKRRLERHAARIEEISGFLGIGRATERTRRDLRSSYAAVRERYVAIEERLDGVANSLNQAGLPILGDTLNDVRSSTGERAVAAAQQGLARAGEKPQGDKAAAELPVLSGERGGGGANDATVRVGSTGLTGTVGPNGVTIGQTTIPGTYNPDTQTVASPQYGTVSLDTAQSNRAGVTFLQTDKGVLVIPPGVLIAGARLNSDGTISFADGSTVPLDQVAVDNGEVTAAGVKVGDLSGSGAPGREPAGSGTSAAGRAGDAARSGTPGAAGTVDAARYSGALPQNTNLVGADGRRITVDSDAPPFQNGTRSFVRKVYIGARDTILQRETKVTQRLTEVTGDTWRVAESLGESRSWMFRMDLTDTQTSPGKLSGTLRVTDAGGSQDFTIASVQVQDESGQRAEVGAGSGPGVYAVTFNQSGDYTAAAEGATNWGSRFRLEATFPVGVR